MRNNTCETHYIYVTIFNLTVTGTELQPIYLNPFLGFQCLLIQVCKQRLVGLDRQWILFMGKSQTLLNTTYFFFYTKNQNCIFSIETKHTRLSKIYGDQIEIFLLLLSRSQFVNQRVGEAKQSGRQRLYRFDLCNRIKIICVSFKLVYLYKLQYNQGWL